MNRRIYLSKEIYKKLEMVRVEMGYNTKVAFYDMICLEWLAHKKGLKVLGENDEN